MYLHYKKTRTTSRFNSFVMANAQKKLMLQQTLAGHYTTCNTVLRLSVQ
jgi:hypothetical protein